MLCFTNGHPLDNPVAKNGLMGREDGWINEDAIHLVSSLVPEFFLDLCKVRIYIFSYDVF